MKRKKPLRLLAVLVALGVMISLGGIALAGVEKYPVCHNEGNPTTLWLPASAYRTHVEMRGDKPGVCEMEATPTVAPTGIPTELSPTVTPTQAPTQPPPTIAPTAPPTGAPSTFVPSTITATATG